MINSNNLPDDSVNIPKESSLAILIKLSISLMIIAILIFGTLKVVVDFGVEHISDKEAIELTKLISPKLSQKATEDKNLSKIAKEVFECSSLSFEPKIFIIDSKKANAFAFGDGNIYITKPLLKKIDSNEEIAFIIAHEIGHFKHKDHLKKLGMKLILVALASLGVDLDNFILSNTINLEESKYSQKTEIEADRFGLNVLDCVYGRVDGAVSIFNKLRVDEKGSNYLFASHPSFEERLRLIKKWQKLSTTKTSTPQ